MDMLATITRTQCFLNFPQLKNLHVIQDHPNPCSIGEDSSAGWLRTDGNAPPKVLVYTGFTHSHYPAGDFSLLSETTLC